jgi:hypothetical protein
VLRAAVSVALAGATLGLAACGGGTGSTSTTNGAGTSLSPQQQNQQVIEKAQQSPDAQAALTEDQISKKLDQTLNLQDISGSSDSFRLSGGEACYVKLGADAVNFEYMKKNILRSPDGQSVVFVQSFTDTPLADCLVAVDKALGW